jgi:hypothetical protein
MKPSHASQRSTYGCFHSFRNIAVVVILGAVPAFAQEQKETPVEAVKKIGSYVFKPIEIKPSFNDSGYDGKFLFINKELSPVMIFGSDEPLGRKFEPMYLEFQTLKDGRWKELQVGYCGTGAQQFAMQPGKEYVFEVSLDYFDEQDAPLTGKIGLDGYWSEPFVLDWKKDRSAGKFKQARKENFEKARALFAKAGFKNELLEGDDFCNRLLQTMMKETSAKDMATSFHPFVGKLDVNPWMRLDGSIRIDFTSDEIRDFDAEYTGWFVLDPRKFSPELFRKAVKQHVEASKWGEGVEMELNDGSNFKAPFYLCIKYEPFDKAKRPTNEESEKLFRNMLGVMDGWLK